jgi:hypothetical protein
MKSTETHWKFIVDFRILSILLLIAIVPFLLGTWWLVSSYRISYVEAQGINLAEEADAAFNSLNNYIGNQIIEIAGLTEVPTLRDAIDKYNFELKANRSEALKKDAAIEARWKGMDYTSPELRAVLNNPASDFPNLAAWLEIILFSVSRNSIVFCANRAGVVSLRVAPNLMRLNG